MKTQPNKSQTPSLDDHPTLEEQRKAASRELLEQEPSLYETLTRIAGCENFENGRMGVPTREELEEMQSQRWTPVPQT